MFRIKTIENIEVIFQQKARNQDINTSFDQNFKKGDKDSTVDSKLPKYVNSCNNA